MGFPLRAILGFNLFLKYATAAAAATINTFYLVTVSKNVRVKKPPASESNRKVCDCIR